MTKNILALNGGTKTVPDGLRVETWPPITQADEQAVVKVMRRRILSGPNSPETSAWQQEWADFCGTKYCLATNSGTAALHMAVAAAGVEPGDEVITTALSWTSSGTCIMHHGGIPVFVDIDPQTYNIDVNQIEKAISEKTKAIIPVHLYGQTADMAPIMELAEKYNLKVIEDACQAHGATYKGRRAGSLGHMGCFSTQNSKHVACGEGGLFVTNDRELYEAAARVQQFGEVRKEDGTREYNAYGMGWMYRSQELISAFCRSQFRLLEEYIQVLRANCDFLTNGLKNIKGIRVPYVRPECEPVWWDYKVRFCPEELKIDIDSHEFTRKVSEAIEAEGVFLSRWEFVIPDMTLFQQKRGFGKGYPWSFPGAREVSYDVSQYPNAMAAIASMRGIHCIKPPNDLELMKYYVEAFHKVFANLGDVI
jgi:dTDP-4-amino-4,6-dideoxygalactose transaminase